MPTESIDASIATGAQRSRSVRRILTFSSVYPSPPASDRGVFVRARVQALAKQVEVKVVAPIPLLDYGRGLHSVGRSSVPFSRLDGTVEVFHPGWLYPPGGTCVNIGALTGRLFPLLKRLQSSFDFDLIDAHFGYPEAPAAAALAAATGRPFIVTLRGSELLHSQYPSRRSAMAWALRRAALIVAVSNELRSLALDLGVHADRTLLSVNGVDINRFYPRDRALARAKYGILPGQFAVLSAGHLIPLKGHQHVIRAMRALLDRGRNVKLFIAGGRGTGVPGNEASLRELTAQLQLQHHVEFLGAVTQESMPELMSASDLLCLASEREGSPNVVHEALACGTPVIATAVGCVPDAIASVIVGRVLPLEHLSHLADTLNEALNGTWDRRSIAEFGCRRSWDTVVREVLAAVGSVSHG